MKRHQAFRRMGTAVAASLTLALVACAGSAPSETTQATQADGQASEATSEAPAPAGTHEATVVDQSGEPVADVGVAFCDVGTCNIVYTDERGVATFAGDPDVDYEVHIALPPQGFESSDESLQSSSGSLSFTLNRK